MNKLELAKIEEAEICISIINEGKEFQKKQGFTQWTDDYPNIVIIKDDIKKDKGFVLKVDDKIAGYMCIDFEGEPAYDNIEGDWQSEELYAVVHRMSFGKDFRGMGLTDAAFQLIEELCKSKNINYIRVDTDMSNGLMQHVLEKNGFIQCGIIIFQGSGKLAYDKIL